jgi:hypothetical protein
MYTAENPPVFSFSARNGYSAEIDLNHEKKIVVLIMPFAKNVTREDALHKHWLKGNTIKTAAHLTGIPAGTISHYYSRFNRRRELELVRRRFSGQEPPRSTPAQVAGAALSLNEVYKTVIPLMKERSYAEARDYLQALLLLSEVHRKYAAIMGNFDQNKYPEAFREIIRLITILSS